MRRFAPDGARDETDLVVREITVTISLNRRPLVTLSTSPMEPELLAVGYLTGQGLLTGRAAIKKLATDEAENTVHVTTATETAGNEPSPCPDTGYRLPAARVSELTAEFQQRSRLFRATGGVHGAALADTAGIIHFSEDISRRHAIDKVIGYCVLNDVATDHSLLITGGRVAADIVPQVARAGIPVIVSRSAPTDRAVARAERLGITLVGFARGQRMNVYTAAFRIVANQA